MEDLKDIGIWNSVVYTGDIKIDEQDVVITKHNVKDTTWGGGWDECIRIDKEDFKKVIKELLNEDS